MMVNKWIESKRRIMQHFKDLKKAWGKTNAKVILDINDFIIYIHYHDELLAWYPQFKIIRDNKEFYTFDFSEDAKLFLGWRPYLPKAISWMDDKWLFKKWLIAHDFKSPYASRVKEVSSFSNEMIIKKRISSFGKGIRGPYRLKQNQTLNSDEYYEQLIHGDILKIWYWNDCAVVFEKEVMPTVTGNGKNSLKELIEGRLKETHCSPTWEDIQDFLNYQMLDWNTIIEDGKKVWIDFRYGSNFNTANSITEQQISALKNENILAQLDAIGQGIYAQLTKENCTPLVYTLDAILDNNDTLWFLECNANPVIHPQIYYCLTENCLKKLNSEY